METVRSAWETYYVIVGSSAAALTGLQFVVMALVSDRRQRSTLLEIDAFGTPTIVHFCAVLFLSAAVSAPWPNLTDLRIVVGGSGAAGVVYIGLVLARARRQTGYSMVLEDWIWHMTIPFAAYVTLLVSAFVLDQRAVHALFAVATAALALLFAGIHNAWDTVTFIATGAADGGPGTVPPKPSDDRIAD